MKMNTSDMMKIGGAVMAVGTVAAIAMGSKKKNSAKSKIKKFAKKSEKALDGVMDNMQYMFK